MDTSGSEPIDMGIAKLHFEIGSGGGIWQWGNDSIFKKIKIAIDNDKLK